LESVRGDILFSPLKKGLCCYRLPLEGIVCLPAVQKGLEPKGLLLTHVYQVIRASHPLGRSRAKRVANIHYLRGSRYRNIVFLLRVS
jgi:hypothetical protein